MQLGIKWDMEMTHLGVVTQMEKAASLSLSPFESEEFFSRMEEKTNKEFGKNSVFFDGFFHT